MKSSINCLIVGCNEMDVARHLSYIRLKGGSTSEYEYNLKNCAYIENNPYSLGEFSSRYLGMPYSECDSIPREIASIATYLYEKEFQIEMIDSFQRQKQYIIDILAKKHVHTILIPTDMYHSIIPIRDMISFFKTHSFHVPIILSGNVIINETNHSQPDHYVQSVLNSLGGDYYVAEHSPERAIGEIIEHVVQQKALGHGNNVFYKENGHFVKSSLVNIENETYSRRVDWRLFTDQLHGPIFTMASASCSFSCSFCSHPRRKSSHRSLSIKNVEDELNSIAACNNVNTVFFSDDTFNVPLSRFKEILQLIIQKKYKFHWFSFIRCQYLDEETVKLMKEARCRGVYLGIESGDQDMLDRMNKGVSVSDYRQGIQLLKQYDIMTIASLIIGFPGEDHCSIDHTINFINETKPDFVIPLLWFYSSLAPVERDKRKLAIQGAGYNWKHCSMDVQEALKCIDKLLFGIYESVCVPDFRFSYKGLITLLDKGLSIMELKSLVTKFNEYRKNRQLERNHNYEHLGCNPKTAKT
ncbi:radical SAM protein [Paenibacillus mesotrionivorans]|uniref:Radical SAM protein n=1 Tax=Paenibacillus mesotrionivorans TaxID=3160968 RepID=A0ACC7P0C8_9BACL